MFKWLNKKEMDFYSPVDGKVVPLNHVNDSVFARGMMGTGFAIEPTDEIIYAPFDGEITVLFPTGHAIGLKSKEGVEVLLHIGIDTVELKGEGFHIQCSQGDQVQKGSTLLKVDLETVRAHGKESICIVIFPNKENITVLKENKIVKHGQNNIINIKR